MNKTSPPSTAPPRIERLKVRNFRALHEIELKKPRRAQTRDPLLPKLIFGEIRIRETERLIGKIA